MNIREELIDLDAVVNQVSGRINAVAAMSRGLDDPYADGFYFLTDRQIQAAQSLREQTDRCLRAM